MCSMSLKMNAKQLQNMKQLQRLMMSPQMRQALNLMQLPVMELSWVVEQELEQNPLVELEEEKLSGDDQDPEAFDQGSEEKELNFCDDDFEILKRLDEDFLDHFAQSDNYALYRTREEEKTKTFLEQSIPNKETLYQYLCRQARETFDNSKEIAMAEVLIGYFDENGFLNHSLAEIAMLHEFPLNELKRVLLEIQTFDPSGVGAESLQDALLIQLRQMKLEQSLAYFIIRDHWDNLLHNRIPEIKKRLRCSISEIKKAVSEIISRLNFHPGKEFSETVVQLIVPDVSIVEENEELTVQVVDPFIPTLRLNRRYLKMMNDPYLSTEAKEFVKQKLSSVKWLLKNIDQRNETLFRVVSELVNVQRAFFQSSEGELHPLTFKQVANELGIHESTVARAVSNKYLSSPRGVLSLRSLFTNAYQTEVGDEISSNTVKDMLKNLIDNENKKHPLSDENLSQLLKSRGIRCARRTVAKYRSKLQIGNASQRREH